MACGPFRMGVHSRFSLSMAELLFQHMALSDPTSRVSSKSVAGRNRTGLTTTSPIRTCFKSRRPTHWAIWRELWSPDAIFLYHQPLGWQGFLPVEQPRSDEAR